MCGCTCGSSRQRHNCLLTTSRVHKPFCVSLARSQGVGRERAVYARSSTSLLHQQSLTPSACYFAAKELGEGARLYVRSSANVEDMEGMSGAGLYESVPNVRLWK